MSEAPAYVIANFIVHDLDYQALSEHRCAGTEMKFLTMAHGLPPRE
jgi:hypothetical protein